MGLPILLPWNANWGDVRVSISRCLIHNQGCFHYTNATIEIVLIPVLSICTTVKNRSRVVWEDHTLMLFPIMLRSLRDALIKTGQQAEIIITDWMSDDWPLHEWVNDATQSIPARIIQMDGPFSRGKGRNTAADAAVGNVILFLDADMLASPELLLRAQAVVEAGQAFFPVCYSYRTAKHDTGWWRWTGKGNCAMPKALTQVVRWNEKREWGREDDGFMNAVAACVPVIREQVSGFHHQWHPSHQSWKNRYFIRY